MPATFDPFRVSFGMISADDDDVVDMSGYNATKYTVREASSGHNVAHMSSDEYEAEHTCGTVVGKFIIT